MKLGSVFLGAAQAPLGRSSERFSRNLIGDGVRALAATSLLAALEDAVRAAASEIGASVSDLERVIPIDELRALAAKLGENQEAALQAIRRNDLTITNFALPAPAVSPTAHLAGVAEHFARDKHIRRSLTALAADIGAWELLLARAVEAIEGDAALVRRWRWRRIRVYVLVGVVASAIVIAGVSALVIGWRRAAEREARAAAEERERARRAEIVAHVDAALQTPDPCAKVVLSDEERAELTDAQRKMVDGRKDRCDQLARKAEHEKRCAALLAQAASGATDLAPGGETAGDFLVRVATRALEPRDLRATEDAIGTCKDAPLDPIWDAVARDAGTRAFLWGKADGVAPAISSRLGGPNVLAPKAKQSLGFRAETVAKRALRSGKTEDFSGARELCALKAKLAMPPGTSCKGLGSQGR